MPNILMEHEEAKKIVDENGWEEFVQYFEDEFGYNFFSCSTSWYNNEKYICKLKGGIGDVIIGWKGVHGKNLVFLPL